MNKFKSIVNDGVFSSCSLHILAMACMLCDHMWASLFPYMEWMTCVGRIAFPIFAFMIVEGYFHTKDIKKYLLRLLIFAVISEVPFDLLYGSMPIYPYHQNVMWTLMLGLLGILAIETVKKKQKLWLTILTSVGVVLGGLVIGTISMIDFYGAGVVMILVFYFFRGRKWWNYLGQLVFMYYINSEILGGLYYNVKLFGHNFEVVQQAIALVALIPIWLYRGRQGYHAKWFKYLCYGFYPAHLLILFIIWKAIV